MVSFMKDETGVSMIEYGLVAALVGIVCLSSVSYLGKWMKYTFQVGGVNVDNANRAAQSGVASMVVQTIAPPSAP